MKQTLKRMLAMLLALCMVLTMLPVTALAEETEADPYAGYNVYRFEEGYVVDGKALSFKDDISFYYVANKKSAYTGYNKVDNPDTKLTEVHVFNNSGTVIGNNAAVAHFGDTSGVEVRSYENGTSTPTSTLLLPWQVEENEEFIFTVDVKVTLIGDKNRWMGLTVGNKLNDAGQITDHWTLVTRMSGAVAGITYGGTDPAAAQIAWTNINHNNGKQAPIDTISALSVGNTYSLKVIGENKTIDGVEQYVLSSYIDDATIMEDYVIDPSEVSGYLGFELNGINVEIDYDDTVVSQRDTTGYNVYDLNGRDDYRSILQQYELASNVYSKVDNPNITFGKTGFSLRGGSNATNVLLPWKVAADEDFVYTGTFKVTGGTDRDYMALSFANTLDGESIEESTALTAFLHAAMRCNGTDAALSAHKGGTGWRDLITNGRSGVPLTVGETFTFKLVITDGHIMDYYINDTAIVRDFDLETFVGHTSGVPTNAAGYLGINLKNVVLEVDYTTPEGQYVQNGYGVDGYSVNSPAAVAWNTDATVADVLSGGNKPTHFVLNVDKEMNVSAADGTALEGELVDLCEQILTGDSIPMIRVDDMDEATALTEYLNLMTLRDVMVVSTDIDALAQVVRNTQGVRGVYDVSAQSKTYSADELETMMTAANSNDVKVILLSAASADYTSIRWLQSRLMTVWAAVGGNGTIENYTVLTNGVDGVVTGNYSNIKTALKTFTGTNVLLRVPTVGGHRGSKVGADGSVIPEVTVDALLQATAFGADAVECDIQPTKDGVLVLQHDDTTNRMMQTNVTIQNTNYEDLKDILYKEDYSKDADGNFVERTIDTLEDQFKAYADNPNAIFYLELKEVATELEEPMVTELRRLAYEYDIVDQCVVITFDTGAMQAMRKIFPEVSLGFLQSNFTQGVDAVLSTIEPYNGTVNPSYSTAPSTHAYGLYMRGVTIHPWTINGTNLDKYFVTGRFQSLSTDNTIKVSNWANNIVLESGTIDVEPGEAIDFGAAVMNKQGNAIEDAVVTPVKIAGSDLTEGEDGTYSLSEGIAVVMLQYVASTDGVDGSGNVTGVQNYTLYSNPIVISAESSGVSITGLSLDKADLTMNTGSTAALIAQPEPADVTNVAVAWSSSNEAVATVDEDGIVTAVSAGTATITATAGSFSASCDVTVVDCDGAFEIQYLCEEPWYKTNLVSASTGWGGLGVHTGVVNPNSGAYDGGAYIKTGGAYYDHGFAAHAASSLVFDIENMGVLNFQATIGIHNDRSGATAGFTVKADNTVLYYAELAGGQTAEINVTIPKDTKLLTLATDDGGDGNSYDHTTWADPRLIVDTSVIDELRKVELSVPEFLWKDETGSASVSGVLVNGSAVDMTTAEVSYSSSNESVATVDAQGNLTAVSTGYTVITVSVTVNGITRTDSAYVTVGDQNGERAWSVSSPDGNVVVNLSLQDNNKLHYTATKGGLTIVEDSLIGINTDLADFSSGLTFLSSETVEVNDSYTLISGKASTVNTHYNQLTLTFCKGEAYFIVYFRAQADGYAFRYSVQKIDGSEGDLIVYGETSSFDLPAGSKVWAQPDSRSDGKFNHENNFTELAIEDVNVPESVPMLNKSPDNLWTLITEANNYSDSLYVGSYLNPEGDGEFRLAIPRQQASQTGHEEVYTWYPFTSPWRLAITGDLDDVVESNMVTDVSDDPYTEGDWSWVEPGFTSWTWLVGKKAIQSDYEAIKQYVDFASEMGWKYFIMDEGWQPLSTSNSGKKYEGYYEWFDELVEYADARGVKLIAWILAHDLDTEEERKVLAEYAEKGIAGIKVDFFDSDDQDTIQLYKDIYDECVANKLIVNAHGANKPTGENRTYPNVINREAVRGQEYGTISTGQSTIWAFTRGVVGPMDITPKIYHNSNTTTGQQAAMTILFESGMPCMASSIADYKASDALELLRNMPAAWDEIHYIDGYPGQFTTLARRSGDMWYAASITNSTARDAIIPLDFLKEGKQYAAEIYRDGSSAKDIIVEQRIVTCDDTLTIAMSANGGCSVKLIPMDESITGIEAVKEITLAVGESTELSWTVLSDSDAGNDATLSVADSSIASISGTTLTANDVGATTVTITSKLNPTIKTTIVVSVTGEEYVPANGWSIYNPSSSNPTDIYADNANKITLYTLYGDVDYNAGAQNVWLLDAPEGNWEITIQVSHDAMTQNYQKVGIMAWHNDTNVVSMLRRYHKNLGTNVFGMATYHHDTKSYEEPSVADPNAAAPAWLKLTLIDGVFTGYYSFDGETWTKTGEITNTTVSGSDQLKIGVYAAAGNKSGVIMPVDVENFTLNGTVVPFTGLNTVGNAALVESLDAITVDYGTTFDQIELPSQVTVYLDNGQKVTAGVLWNEADFSAAPGEYILTGELDLTSAENCTNTNALSASVTVIVDASALIRAQMAAIEELTEYRTDLGDDNYKDEQIVTLDAILTGAIESIEAAETYEAIDAALDEAKAAMDAVPTALEMDIAEALAAAKAAKEAAEAARIAAEKAAAEAADNKEAAELAMNAAELAQAKAEEAQVAAETAQAKAEEAQKAAQDNNTAAAAEAAKAAEAAANAAVEAGNAATAASDAAAAALSAQTAQAKAEDAQAKAEAALAAAEAAANTAANNMTAAEAAKTAAELAQSSAESAKAQAEAALEAASAAAESAKESNTEAAEEAKAAADAAAESAASSNAAASAASAAAESARVAQEAQKSAEDAAAQAVADQAAAEKAKEDALKAAAETALSLSKYNALCDLADFTEELTADTTADMMEDLIAVSKAARAAILAAETEEAVAEALAAAQAEMESIGKILCAAEEFTDVDVNEWYHEAIDFVINEGMMSGNGDGTFAPETELSRAMLVQILYNIEGRPQAETEKSFSDVSEDDWYYNAVMWAADNGIVLGNEDGTYAPDDNVTREQMVTILYRYAGSPEVEDTAITFTDAADVDDYAKTAVIWAVANEVVKGKGDNRFDPDGNSTRAETAQVMLNYFGN